MVGQGVFKRMRTKSLSGELKKAEREAKKTARQIIRTENKQQFIKNIENNKSKFAL